MPLKASIPLQQLLQLATTKLPPIAQQHHDRSSFPTNNDVTDPLSWLSGCMFSFRGQRTPNNMKTGCEILHLIEIAQLQHMHLTENKAATNGEHLAPCDTKYIGPPNQGDLREERLQINIYIMLINDAYDID
jgi:hypothetical protein